MTKSTDQEFAGSARVTVHERRRQLLDAAVRVISSRGVAAASTRAISEEAGVPQGLFHYCFESRQALLRALLERETQQSLAMAASIIPRGADLAEALRVSFDTQLRRVGADPEHFAVLSALTVYSRTDPQFREVVLRQRANDLALIADLLRQWNVDGMSLDLDKWAAVILAGLDGITESWLTDRDDATRDRTAHLLAAAVGAAVTDPRN